MQREPPTGAQTTSTILNDQAVAERLGIDVAHVVEFCQQNGLPQEAGHYSITPTNFDQLQAWARDKGYLSGGSSGRT